MSDLPSLVLDSVSDSIFVINLDDYTIVTTNRTALEQLKMVESEVVGRTCYEVTHQRSSPCKPPDQPCPIREMKETGSSVIVTHTYLDKDGNPRYYEIQAHPIKDDKGNINQMVYVAKDITERKRIEKELVESEMRYKTFLEASRDAVFVLDKTKYLYLNRSAAELLGFSDPQELIGRDAFEFVAPEDREMVRSMAIARQNGEERPNRYDFKLVRRDGTKIDVEAHVSVIGYEGKLVSLAVNRDITEWKQHEEKLEALYSHRVELGMVNTVKEVAESTFSILEKVFGFSRGGFAVVERGLLRFIHVKGFEIEEFFDLPLDGRGITVRAARTGETQLISDVRLDDDFVPGLAEGVYEALSELAVPVKIDNEVVAVINVENIEQDAFTEEDRRLLELFSEHVASAMLRIKHVEMLRTTEERYKTLLEASMDAVFVIADERFTYVNRRAAEFLGFSDPSEVIGREAEEFIAPEDRKRVMARIRGMLKGEEHPSLYEFKLFRKDGTTIDVETNVSIIEYEGKLASLTFTRDITERKRMEVKLREHMEHLEELVKERTRDLQAREEVLREQNIRLQRLDEMKSRFISTATHELRTPLVSMKGYVDLIRSGRVGEVPKTIDGLLEIVERNTVRLSDITNDLMDQQRIESGRLQIKPETIKLQDVIKEIIEEFEPPLSERDQVLDIQVPADLPSIWADRIRIGQVLLNLLNNASKFSPPDANINLRVREVGDMVEVQVSDRGIGIRGENFDKLFEPFPDIEKPGVYGGTGLGLSICKGIIDLHGGRIWAESKGEGRGSTFTFTIPKQAEAE